MKEFPENSFSALTKSFEAGFGIETDLRLTQDGDFILIHDDNFKRLAGKDTLVAETICGEAEKIRYLDSAEHIISFRALLTWLAGKKFRAQSAVQLKVDSQNEAGFQLLAKYWREFNLYETAFTFDLTKESAARLKEIDPRIKIALIVSEFKFEPTIYLWNEVRDFQPMDIVWAAEYRNLYAKDFIDQVKSSGRRVFAVSPDVHGALGHPFADAGYEKTWENLLNWSIDGICTDFPAKLKAHLGL